VTKISTDFKDENAEAAIIGTLLKQCETFYDLSMIIGKACFSKDHHNVVYNCIKHAHENDVREFDIPIIISSAKEIGYGKYFDNEMNYSYLKFLPSQNVKHDNAILLAKKIKKLYIAKTKHDKLEEAQKQYKEISGEESIEHILAIAEKAVFFQEDIDEINNTNPIMIGDRMDEYLEQLSQIKGKEIGLATGFQNWDEAIVVGS